MPLYVIPAPAGTDPKLEATPQINLNGEIYSFDWNTPTELPEGAVPVLEAGGLTVSPADDSDVSDGDAAAVDEPGGDSGGGDTPHPLDHDGDGEKGGSLPAEPPSLSGKTKAELLEIAKDEGVKADKSMTNDAITKAIEAKRNA